MNGFATLAQRLTRCVSKILFIGVVATPWMSSALAQQAQLAMDIAPGIDPRVGFQVENAIEFNGKFIVSAANPRDGLGYELYEFDPATGGNRLLKDIAPGSSNSQPRYWVVHNDHVYFTANSNNVNDPSGIVRYNPNSGEVSQVPVSGQQDLSGGFYYDMVLFDNKLYFSSNIEGQGVVGFYDLTTTTVQHLDLPQGTFVSAFLEYDNSLLLVSRNVQTQSNVFLFQLTSGSTTPTAFGSPADSNFLRSAETFRRPVIVGDRLYFSGSNSSFENELYQLDLVTGSYQRYDINAGAASSSPQNFFSYQSTLYFTANDGVTGRELLYAFGATDGAPQAIDVTGFSFPSFRSFFGFGDHVYFTASTLGTGGEPYRISTTTRETEFLGDLYEGPNWSNPQAYVVYNQQLYSHFSTLERGGNYHVLNPDDGSFSIVGSGNDAPASSYADGLYVFGDALYFKAVTADYATELFRYTQSTDAVEQLTEFTNQEMFINGTISPVIGYGTKLFFTVSYQFQSPELYSLDVETDALTLLTTITTESFFNFVDPVVLGDKIYFNSNIFVQNNSAIGVLDPQTGTIAHLSDQATGFDPTQTATPTVFNGRLYFRGNTAETGFELFGYDPQSNVIEVFDFNPGSESSFPQIAAVTDELLYLQIYNTGAADPSTLYQLDVNNNLNQIEGGPSQFGSMLVHDGIAVFQQTGTNLGFYDFASGEITNWDSADLANGEPGIFFNGDFFRQGDDVFVRGNSVAYGQSEIFKVDFTNNVATVYAELNAGPLGSDVRSPVDYGNSLYFSGFRPDVGYELFRIVTNVNRAPTISGTPTLSVNEGQAYSFVPTGADLDGDDLTYSINIKPDWANFSALTGALTGTPGFDDAGTTNGIIISVSDGTDSAALPAFNLTVNNVNRAPTISGTPTLSVNEGQAYSFVPTGADLDGDDLTYSINIKPDWANFSALTGALTGTPGFDDAGTTNGIIISVSDGTDSAALPAFNLTVNNVNRAPTISGTPTLSVNEGQAYSFVPTGADLDGDDLTYSINIKPDWALFSSQTGALTGTPGFDDAGTTNGIIISVSDGTDSAALSAFNLTVNNVNRAPTISGTPVLTATAQQPYSFQVSADDIDVGDQLTYGLRNQPSWLTVNGAGLVSGTPTDSDVGLTNAITVFVSDGNGGEATLTPFQIDVQARDLPPEIIGVNAPEATQGQPYVLTLTATDEKTAELSWTFEGLPNWLKIIEAAGPTARLEGIPDQAAATRGSEQFLAQVLDEKIQADQTTVTITIIDVNLQPVFTTQVVTVALQDTEYRVELEATDADNDELVFTAQGLPTWLHLENGVLFGTPRNADVGYSESFTLTVDDQQGGTDTITVVGVFVENINDAPTIYGNPPTTAKVGVEYSFAPTAADIDIGLPSVEEVLTFSAENLPTWLDLNTSTGVLSGTPTEDDISEYVNIILTVTDAGELDASLPPFSIEVSPRNQPPVAVDDEFEVTVDIFTGRISFDVGQNDSDPDGDQLSVVGAKLLRGPSGISVQPWVDFGSDHGAYSGKIEITGLLFTFKGELTFEYTITDPSGERATAKATVWVNVDAPEVITLTPPADITIYATGPWTEVSSNQLGTATATNQLGQSVAVNMGGLKPAYAPGLHSVTWNAGSGNSAISKTQTIRVVPQVSLKRDVSADAGQMVRIPLSLNGSAPEYPYSVGLTYNGQPLTATFTVGTDTAIEVQAPLTSGESYALTLNAGTNSGDVTQIQVLAEGIVLPKRIAANAWLVPGSIFETARVSLVMDTPLPPLTVESVRITRFNRAIPGSVEVEQFNNDTYNVVLPQFLQRNTMYDVVLTLSFNGQTTYAFASLAYRLQPEVVSDPIIAGFEYSPYDDDLSRELDQNDNGFVDYQDGRWDFNANAIPAYLDRALNNDTIWADGAYAFTRVGQHISALPLSVDAASIRVATVPELIDQELVIEDVSNYSFIGDFYSLGVLTLEDFGATASVALPLDAPLGAGTEFLLWQNGLWRSFVPGADGELYSAGSIYGACPSVGSNAWQPGFNEGHWCVRLDIVDGGVNDTDGEANAQVRVFGGAAIDAAGNSAPVAVADTAVAVWRGSVSVPVLANDTDADGHALSVLSASVDIGTVTVNAARNAVQYVSPGDFAGAATITYVVSDNNGGIAVGTATVTVLENRAPVLGADTAVTVAGRPVTVNVLANDADPDGDTLSITEVSVAAASGTASFSGASVSFAPAAGFVGVASVSYSVSDGRGGSATGTLTVQVAAAPEVIEVRPASGTFWWFLGLGGLALALRRRLR